MAVNLGSTFKELIDEINSKGSGGDYVKLTTDQTISGIKTFNAPTDVSGKETITTKFKTSNGGALIIGKEGANSGTMLRFDQVDGTCRLRFRSSATAGAVVWSQPEKNAVLYFDMGNSKGTGMNRVTLRNVAGTLALTKELPAAVSANPTLSGSETELTGLQIGSTKYKIPTGGGGDDPVIFKYNDPNYSDEVYDANNNYNISIMAIYNTKEKQNQLLQQKRILLQDTQINRIYTIIMGSITDAEFTMFFYDGLNLKQLQYLDSFNDFNYT